LKKIVSRCWVAALAALVVSCGGGGGSSSPSAAASSSSGGSSGSGTPAPTPACGATGSSTLSIRACGNRLVDAAGDVVQLRGVNVSALESPIESANAYNAVNPWGGQTGDDTPNWSVIKTWGGAGTTINNAVRIPLNQSTWLAASCTNDSGQSINPDPAASYKATVDATVANATAAGLYVILDLHISAPGKYCAESQNAGPDQDHSLTFWSQVAARYKSNPAVMFEAFNEPFLSQISGTLTPDNAWAVLLNGGADNNFTDLNGNYNINLNWQVAGMQQIVTAIRNTGATNVVLIAPLAFSSALDGWLQYKPTDPAGQMAAVWHAYPADGYPTQVSCVDTGAANTAGNLPGCSAQIMADAQAILAAGYPIVITEYGDTITGSAGNTAPWASVLLPFADKNGISYLGWTWDDWSGFNADVLITDEKGTPTNGYGTYVKQHYTCVAAGTANCP
jgi:endoglucanase